MQDRPAVNTLVKIVFKKVEAGDFCFAGLYYGYFDYVEAIAQLMRVFASTSDAVVAVVRLLPAVQSHQLLPPWS